MPIVKCELCGKEYQLKSGENLSDFQCTCGGNLNYVKTNTNGFFNKFNQQPTLIKILSGVGVLIIIIVLIIGVGGLVTPSQNITESTNASTQNNTPTQVQATWHNLITFTNDNLDVNSNLPSFTTKGTQFKVIIEASSDSEYSDLLKYSSIGFTAKSKGSDVAVGSGELKNFTTMSEKGEFTVYADPGEYYLHVSPIGIKNFKIQIVDYY